jgi:hypothetical protein
LTNIVIGALLHTRTLWPSWLCRAVRSDYNLHVRPITNLYLIWFMYNFHRIWWTKILIIVFFSLTRFDLTWILGQRKSSLVNNWGFNLSSGSHIISRRFGVGLSYGCVEPLNHKHITVLFLGMLTKSDNILTVRPHTFLVWYMNFNKKWWN